MQPGAERPQWLPLVAINAFSATLAWSRWPSYLGPAQERRTGAAALSRVGDARGVLPALGSRRLGTRIPASPGQHAPDRARCRADGHRPGLLVPRLSRARLRRGRDTRLRPGSTAITHEGLLQRRLRRSVRGGGCGHLPGAPERSQPGEPRRMGRGHRGVVRTRGDLVAQRTGRHDPERSDDRAPDRFPAGDARHVLRRQRVPRHRGARCPVVQHVGDASAGPRGRTGHRGVPGVHTSVPALRVAATPLRLQPGPRHGEPRAVVHEPGGPAAGLHGHASTPGAADPGRAIGDPPPNLPGRPRAVGGRAHQPRQRRRSSHSQSRPGQPPPRKRDPRQQKSSYDPVAGRYTAAIVAPVIDDNTAIGAIVALDRDEELDEFDQDDLRLFEALVAHASANLERARLVEELRYEVDSKSHQATHDMLTGLPNRMLFVTRATTALERGPGRRHHSARPRPIQGRQ